MNRSKSSAIIERQSFRKFSQLNRQGTTDVEVTLASRYVVKVSGVVLFKQVKAVIYSLHSREIIILYGEIDKFTPFCLQDMIIGS